MVSHSRESQESGIHQFDRGTELESVSESPLVSVIVPNYNHLRFLTERLESIFEQTFKDYEVILLDDCSSDGSVEYLKTFTSRPNVRLIVNSKNSESPFAQWNRGVQEARGELIWIAESDDSAESNFLESCVQGIRDYPNVGIVSCNVLQIDENDEVIGQLRHDAFPDLRDRWETRFQNSGRSEVQNYLYMQNTLPSAGALLFRKKVYLQAGEADCSLKIAGDWLQWCKLLAHSDYLHIGKPLACSRTHDQNQRSTSALNGNYERECLCVQKQIQNLVPIEKEIIKAGLRRYTKSWLQGVRALRLKVSFFDHFKMVACAWSCHRISAIVFLIQLLAIIALAQIKQIVRRPKSHS